MSNWFDERAKRSARRHARAQEPGADEQSSGREFSRRDALKRGGIIAGVAWTAPVLMSVMTPAAAVSSCPAGQVLCPNTAPNAEPICCPPDNNCVLQDNGLNACIVPGGLGGDCRNNGSGTSGCFQNGNSSIHCNNGNPDNICGGIGAQCNVDAECANPLVCVDNAGPGNQDACGPA